MDGFVSNRPLMSAQIACFHVEIYTVWWLPLATVFNPAANVFLPLLSIKIFVLVSMKAAFTHHLYWYSSKLIHWMPH